MITLHDSYTVYEANQVLTAPQLNSDFDYQDEQARLTRANLIGIGIVCGLDVTIDAPTSTVTMTKGCGVTSQGYLIVEPSDVELRSRRRYTLPPRIAYPEFTAADPGGAQFELWEICPDGEPGTQSLQPSDLANKVLVLFLELNRSDLRTCTPNSCDDRGESVTATVRRLLVGTDDLDAIIAHAAEAAPMPDRELILDRMALPDLRLPRVDVPSSNPVSAEDVLFAFQRVFVKGGLVEQTANALNDLYQRFLPLLRKAHPANPFQNFSGRFGFLDTTPTSTTDVRFLQYFVDFFADLFRGYDEFRWAAIDLLCACVPPDGLFPRHLVLGVVDPGIANPDRFRHAFLPSPAIDGRCGGHEAEMLFDRLVNMIANFHTKPALAPAGDGLVDEEIRITPSRWGPDSLGSRAIPYYYRQDVARPLRTVWNSQRSRRGRSDQNLGYHSFQYDDSTPRFVTEPLTFDLEPDGFLRIEGHLGKDVKSALRTLLTYKAQYRLPIEVVALRTGEFDERMPVDISREDCRFDDLEALYATLKAELSCFLCKEVRYFYDLPDRHRSPITTDRAPAIAILTACAPDYQVRPGTLGRRIEDALDRRPLVPAVLLRASDTQPQFALHAFALVTSMSALSTQLSSELHHLDFEDFGDRYHELVDVAEQFDDARAKAIAEPADQSSFAVAGLTERLNDIIFRCRLDPFRALAEEYKRRIRKARQQQFLTHFLTKHPGIQHKAGVPLGGTFILVYHESAPPSAPTAPREPNLLPLRMIRAVESVVTGPNILAGRPDEELLSKALTQLRFRPELANEPAVRTLYESLTGEVFVPRRPPAAGKSIYNKAIAEIAEGTVIADFYLPYLCCSDCTSMQYTLPKDRPRLTVRLGCTDPVGTAEATLMVEGAVGGISVQIDGGPFIPSRGKLRLGMGAHTVVIRDDEGTESAPVQVVVPAPLTVGVARIDEDGAAGTYRVSFEIAGGTAPYTAAPGAVDGTTYTGEPVPNGQPVTVTITDANGCTASEEFQHSACDLPCGGAAIRQHYRFWLPAATQGLPINEYVAEVGEFSINGPAGPFTLTNDVQDIVNSAPSPIRTADFDSVAARWIDHINERIARAVGSPDWVRLEYVPADESSTTGSFTIDRLDCVEVNFALQVRYIQGRVSRVTELKYTAAGTGLHNLEPQPEWDVLVPPFDTVTSNKCRPGEPPVLLCGDLSLRVSIESGGDFPNDVFVSARWDGNDAPQVFLWEVEDATPALANGEVAHFALTRQDRPEKRVRLVAFTEAGCAAVATEMINFRG